MKAIPTILFLFVLLTFPNITLQAQSKMTTYQEKHRPQLHFSPPEKWMNDPNGMVYFEEEYHLFYQYYPDSTVWGPMHWGHAISKDLVHWEQLPVALFPDKLGYIFSGSAVVDWKNTSGLGTVKNPPLIAIYTYHHPEKEKAGDVDFQTQGLAYSQDKGRTWTKYAGNPVLKNPGIKDFRDPKVFWYSPTSRWVMSLAVWDHIRFYTSPDLIHWSFESEFGKEKGAHGGVWECPDLFALNLPGSTLQKWILLVSINPGGPNGGSATQYFIGDFDGKRFTSEQQETLWLDQGLDNYAGVTWSDIPEKDGRKLLMGWMSNWQYAQVVPTSPWRSAMTLPRKLLLGQTKQGLRLLSQPAEELIKLRKKTYILPAGDFTGHLAVKNLPERLSLPMEILLETNLAGDGKNDLTIEFSNQIGQKLLLGFDAQKNEYFIDRTRTGTSDFFPAFALRHSSPRLRTDQSLKLHLFIDVSSIEIFADDGEVAMSDLFFPDQVFDRMYIQTEASMQIRKGQLYTLHSIWK